MKNLKMMISAMVMSILLCLIPVMPVYAQEELQSISEVVQDTEDDVMSGTGTLALKVSYPSDIRCGQPVTFKMTATGGTGNYKYRIAALMDSTLMSVYDVSYGSNSVYGDSDEFSFTFYASGTYYIRFSVMDMGSQPYQTKMTGLYEYPVVIQDPNYPSVDQIVANVTKECLKTCSTDFEKAVYLHDWIIDHAEYDHTYSYSSAEGVLARGTGTCESYHRAYCMLLNKIGIETGRIEGNGHVWTAARLDGAWYQIDSTWDDMGADYKGTFYEHMYFGLTDDIIRLVHSDHQQPVQGYECTSLDDNYFIKTGEIHQWSDPFVSTIRQKLAAGQTKFTLPINSSMPDNYNNVIYNLVAYQLSMQSWTNVNLSVSYANNVLTCSATKKNTLCTSTTLTGKQKFVALLYENVLERYAAASEIDYWVAKINEGQTGSSVAYCFLFSDEFQKKNLGDRDYIERLYRSMMGRGSDSSGKNHWAEYLANGVSRLYVFNQFVVSNEFTSLCSNYGIQRGNVSLTEARDVNYDVTRFVTRNYSEFLSRTYDVGGLNNWCNYINNGGGSMRQTAYGFVFSEECTGKKLSNQAFVKMLYRGLMDREGEAAGVEHWTGLLATGALSREEVFWGFADSQEFTNLVRSYGL